MTIAPPYLHYLEHFGQTVPVKELHNSPRKRNITALRHDVDHSLEAALEMAWLEAEQGFRSTYFLLHSAPYWDDAALVDSALQLQDFGHEVGLHLNVIAEWMAGTIDCVEQRLSELLKQLRDGGVEVVGVSAHGDPLCYRQQFTNHWMLRDLQPKQLESLAGLSAEGIASPAPEFQVAYPECGELRRRDGATLALWQTSMERHGLEYSAVHVPRAKYFTDSGGSWTRSPDPLTADFAKGRSQVLMHPEHWWSGSRRLFALSTARSGTAWLARVMGEATPMKASHESTLNRDLEVGEVIDRKRTGIGFADLIDSPDELRRLVGVAAEEAARSGLDVFESNPYLAHVLPALRHGMPEGEAFHLVRDPRETVRSLLERDWYDVEGDTKHPEFGLPTWAHLTQLEKVCWYVRLTCDLLSHLSYPVVRLEDLTTSRANAADILAKMNVAFLPRLARSFDEVTNAGRTSTVEPFDEWPAADQATFDSICGSLLQQYGYAGEVPAVSAPARLVPASHTETSEVVLVPPADRSAFAAPVGADWDPGSPRRLRLVPDLTRHANLVWGTSTWSRLASGDGWDGRDTLRVGGTWRAAAPGGSARLFALFFDEDGQRSGHLLLATATGKTQAYRYAFKPRSDASRWTFAIQLQLDRAPTYVHTYRLTADFTRLRS